MYLSKNILYLIYVKFLPPLRREFVPANDSSFVIEATVSDLILADNKNTIKLSEIIELKKQLLALKHEIEELKKNK